MDVDLLESWARHLRARNRSPATIAAYLNDARTFTAWLEEENPDLELTDARGTHVEEYLASVSQRVAAATVARRYRSLQQLFAWLVREEEMIASPMGSLSPPAVPVQPPPVITDEEMKRLIAACTGKAFDDRRDRAIVLMLATTGIRSAEIMGLALDDVDLKRGVFEVLGKGRRRRLVELLPKAADALDAYLRARRRHPMANSPMLWIGTKGPLTNSGLRQMLERRCAIAGIKPINPHKFRHTFAHRAKSLGMNDGDLMAIAGWKSPQMLHRYGASAAAERARAAHRRIFEGEEP